MNSNGEMSSTSDQPNLLQDELANIDAVITDAVITEKIAIMSDDMLMIEIPTVDIETTDNSPHAEVLVTEDVVSSETSSNSGSSNSTSPTSSSPSLSPTSSAEAIPVIGTEKINLPFLIQKEMSKMFSARCDVNQLDLVPFKVIMNVIREHYQITNKPEITRVLIRLLSQYQPVQGVKEYDRLIALCEDLLSSVDESVREAFLSMIPTPFGSRHSTTGSFQPNTCGHLIRDIPKKYEANPLSETIRRPLLSYQTMSSSLFAEPYPVPSYESVNDEANNDSLKYFNKLMSTGNIASNANNTGNAGGYRQSRSNSGPSNNSNHSLSNNSVMWFARTNPSPVQSSLDYITTPIADNMYIPQHSVLHSASTATSGEYQKQQLMKSWQQDTQFTKPSVESSLGPKTVSLMSEQEQSSVPWMTIPTYNCSRSNVLLAASSSTQTPIMGDISSEQNEANKRKEAEENMNRASSGSFYLDHIMKSPGSPDCTDPFADCTEPLEVPKKGKRAKPTSTTPPVPRKKQCKKARKSSA